MDTQSIADPTYFLAETGEKNGQIVGGGGRSKRNTLFGGDEAKSNKPDSLLTPGSSRRDYEPFTCIRDGRAAESDESLQGACERAARNEGSTSIELIATLPGQPLYEANGYQVVCPFEIPLPNGLSLPAFRMAKNLLRL